LSIAVARGGGLGACGALLMQPEAIKSWAASYRQGSNGAFQINLWVPDPEPVWDPDHESRVRRFVARFGPEAGADAGKARPPDFDAQCAAVLEIAPPVVSSVMGLFSPAFVDRLKARGMSWWATATTVAEARAAEAAGADAIIAQGFEAGGHRGSFDARDGARKAVGLFSLLPAVVDAVRLPVIATGGIADHRGIAAALMLGASAVQIGTGFLRCPEAGIPTAWADALAVTPPEASVLSAAFSGRFGRTVETEYTRAAAAPDAPPPLPYPVQRGMTQAMRDQAARTNSLAGMQAWAGQSAALASAEPASALAERLWAETQRLLAP
jgi:nitronate monooxygenase